MMTNGLTSLSGAGCYGVRRGLERLRYPWGVSVRRVTVFSSNGRLPPARHGRELWISLFNSWLPT